MGAVNILYDFCIMSALLFVAKIIRSKVPVIQNLYIPVSLLAGFLGMLLGKHFLNVLPFSSEIGNYSSILIAVLFASLFLGNKSKTSFKKMMSGVGDTFLINGAAEIAQYGVFILIGLLVLKPLFPDLHDGFGVMLPAGFIGGHGTAAAIGSIFDQAGWSEATSIGQTIATVGLLLGILGGVILINIGTRKGYTRIIKKASALPKDLKTGLIDEENRDSMGDITVSPISIDPITWHLSLILVAVGAAYLANMGLQKVLPQISFPTYGIALIFSVLLQFVLRLLKLDNYVDKRVITRIGSTATDYLVAFGVASINISVVVKYWLPILILCVLGLVYVVLFLFLISKRFFHNYWFERGMYIFGMATGVLSTGVILLRILDPEFKSGVLEDFGIAWIFLSVVDLIVVSISPVLILQGYGIIAGVGLLLVAIISILISGKIYGLQKGNGTELRKGEEISE